MNDGPYMVSVLELATRCIEERALKTRQFFNAIAEDWDELNREVLGGFDLAAAVSLAMPEGAALAVDLGCGTGAVLERLLPRARWGVIYRLRCKKSSQIFLFVSVKTLLYSEFVFFH